MKNFRDILPFYMVLALLLTAFTAVISPANAANDEIRVEMPSIFQQAVGTVEASFGGCLDENDCEVTIVLNGYIVTVGEDISDISDNALWYLSEDTTLICPLNGTDVKECKKVNSVG